MTDVVRWKKGHRWVYGEWRAMAVEADGSMRVYQQSDGRARSLRAGMVEIETKGPRGGKKWVSIREVLRDVEGSRT